MMRIGMSLYRPEDAAAALREYAAIVPTLPRSIGWHAALKHDIPALPFVPPELVGARLLMFIAMWLDDADDPAGAELVDRLGAVGRPCLTASTVLPFGAAVQKLLDEEFPDGQRYYTKEAHLSDLADEAIDRLVAFWKDMPMHGEVEILGLGGAIGDVPEDQRSRDIVRDLGPWVGNRIYVNMLNFDEMDRVVEAFGGAEKYARLGRVKARYDPGNLFRMNYNITPVQDDPAAPAGRPPAAGT
jgi:hypothetical protein